MKQLKNMKDKNVYFTAFQITAYTDIMYEKMKSSFGKNFSVTKEVTPEQFLETMSNTMSTSIADSRM